MYIYIFTRNKSYLNMPRILNVLAINYNLKGLRNFMEKKPPQDNKNILEKKIPQKNTSDSFRVKKGRAQRIFRAIKIFYLTL